MRRWTAPAAGLALGIGLFSIAILFSRWPSGQRPGGWKVFLSESTGSWFVRIECQGVIEIPSECMLRATVTAPDGKVTFEEEFSGGWRVSLSSGKMSQRKADGERLLELCSDGNRIINGPDIEKQYYQVLDGILVLVRLENEDGSLAQNNYLNPNKTIGPKLRSKTSQAWEESLWSSREGEILEALVWLGGKHADPASVPIPHLLHEDLTNARLVAEVHKRLRVHHKLEELSHSSNAWLREAAGFALKSDFEALWCPGPPPASDRR